MWRGWKNADPTTVERQIKLKNIHVYDFGRKCGAWETRMNHNRHVLLQLLDEDIIVDIDDICAKERNREVKDVNRKCADIPGELKRQNLQHEHSTQNLQHEHSRQNLQH